MKTLTKAARTGRAMGLALALALSAGMAAGLATGDQPSGAEPDHRAGATREADTDARGGAQQDPEMLRRRIEAAIERGEQALERQRAMLEMLEAGTPPAEVMRLMRTEWREGASGRGARGDRDARADRRRGPNNRPEDAPGMILDPEDHPGAMPPPPEGPGGRGTTEDDREGRSEREPGLERLRAIFREHFPEMNQQLVQIEQSDPESARRLFARLSPRIRSIAIDLERDPELGTLRIEEVRAGLEVAECARSLSSAEDREEGERTLREAIGRQFDARMALRRYEVERLFQRISDLNDEITRDTQDRDQEIGRVYDSVIERSGRGERRP